MFELTCFDNRKSFYGKATVIECKEGRYLRSYDTIVCFLSYGGTFIRLWDGYSGTTMRHINSFMHFCGLPYAGKAWWDGIKVNVGYDCNGCGMHEMVAQLPQIERRLQHEAVQDKRGVTKKLTYRHCGEKGSNVPTMQDLTASGGKYEYHHTAMRRGYVSRKTDGKIEPYSGRFGTGYVILRPRYDTTQYVDVSYYIEK